MIACFNNNFFKGVLGGWGNFTEQIGAILQNRFISISCGNTPHLLFLFVSLSLPLDLY